MANPSGKGLKVGVFATKLLVGSLYHAFKRFDREVHTVYLCICKSVSDRQIREAVELGARTIGDLSIRLGIGVECGKCTDSVREFLDVCLAAPQRAATDSALPAVVATPAPPPPRAAEPAPAQAAWFAVDL